VFLSFQEKFDIVVSFVRNVSLLKRKCIFLLKKCAMKKNHRRDKTVRVEISPCNKVCCPAAQAV